MWLDHGSLVDAILASSAIPSVYPSVVIDGVRYRDGAIVNDVPISRAVDLGATKIYVLHVGKFDRPRLEPKRPLDVAVEAYWIARRHRFTRDLHSLPDDVEAVLLPTGAPPAVAVQRLLAQRGAHGERVPREHRGAGRADGATAVGCRRCRNPDLSRSPARDRPRPCSTAEPADALAALDEALASDPDRRAVTRLRAVVARWPRFLDGWARLGEYARDDVEAYAAFRVGYHRGSTASARTAGAARATCAGRIPRTVASCARWPACNGWRRHRRSRTKPNGACCSCSNSTRPGRHRRRQARTRPAWLRAQIRGASRRRRRCRRRPRRSTR